MSFILRNFCDQSCHFTLDEAFCQMEKCLAELDQALAKLRLIVGQLLFDQMKQIKLIKWVNLMKLYED